MDHDGKTASIWEGIYAQGRMLWYPYEIVVRITHRLAKGGGLPGVILDHGCGSGNHLEFFARLGLEAVGSEVSESARKLIEMRFAGAKLPSPVVAVFDPDKPLDNQLPEYSNVLVWGSAHYGPREKVLADYRYLIEHTPSDGAFIAAVPTLNDIAARKSVMLDDGTRRISEAVSGQEGALITVPESREEFVGWCDGIEVEDVGTFGWMFGGEQTEFLFLYGRRK